jgi:hypothetical protein
MYVSRCTNVCVYVCMCVCVCVCVCVLTAHDEVFGHGEERISLLQLLKKHLYGGKCVCVCVCLCVNAEENIGTQQRTCLYVCVCVCVCVYTCKLIPLVTS